MMYKGYTIKRTTQALPGMWSHAATGIFDGDRLVAYVQDDALARRAIDAHTAAGIWPARESEEKTIERQ